LRRLSRDFFADFEGVICQPGTTVDEVDGGVGEVAKAVLDGTGAAADQIATGLARDLGVPPKPWGA
jgi:hypothetical protein